MNTQRILKGTGLSLFALSIAFAVSPKARAGDVNGASCAFGRVEADNTVYYDEVYRADEPASFAVSGDGTTDLDVIVYDENGNPIAWGTGVTDRESVSWIPRWSGRFRIEVRNYGDVWNDFTVCTN
jgi:hypothetical protein